MIASYNHLFVVFASCVGMPAGEAFFSMGVPGILKLRIQIVADKIEESFEICVAGVFGYLPTAIVDVSEKGEYFLSMYALVRTKSNALVLIALPPVTPLNEIFLTRKYMCIYS